MPQTLLTQLASGSGSFVLSCESVANVSADNAQVQLQAAYEEAKGAWLGTAACLPFGWSCQADGDCCSANCAAGQCGCGGYGTNCSVNSDCCYSLCEFGEQCALSEAGAPCTNEGGDCMSQTCSGSVCSQNSPGANGECFLNSDCTSNNCSGGGGEYYGLCACNPENGSCQTSDDCCSDNDVCNSGMCCWPQGTLCDSALAGDCCSGVCAAPSGGGATVCQ